jgi:hypothetical protein
MNRWLRFGLLIIRPGIWLYDYLILTWTCITTSIFTYFQLLISICIWSSRLSIFTWTFFFLFIDVHILEEIKVAKLCLRLIINRILSWHLVQQLVPIVTIFLTIYSKTYGLIFICGFFTRFFPFIRIRWW